MSHNDHLPLRPRHQPTPGLPRPRLHRAGIRGEPPPPLLIPPGADQRPIHRAAVKLPLQLGQLTPRITRQIAGLLQVGQGDDGGSRLAVEERGEAEQGRPQGPFYGRGDDEVDLRVGGGEVAGQGAALVFAERGQEGVVQGVVGEAEVVVALGVADAVDAWGHGGGWGGEDVEGGGGEAAGRGGGRGGGLGAVAAEGAAGARVGVDEAARVAEGAGDVVGEELEEVEDGRGQGLVGGIRRAW